MECQVCLNSLAEDADVTNNVSQSPPGRASRKRSRVEQNSQMVSTKCGHVFHRICIENWLKTNNAHGCPSCRKVAKPLKPIFLPTPNVTPEDATARNRRESERQEQEQLIQGLRQEIAKLRQENENQKQTLKDAWDADKLKLANLQTQFQIQTTEVKQLREHNHSLGEDKARLQKELQEMQTREQAEKEASNTLADVKKNLAELQTKYNKEFVDSRELRQRHQLLSSDMDDLMIKYLGEQDKNALLQGTVNSLKSELLAFQLDRGIINSPPGSPAGNNP